MHLLRSLFIVFLFVLIVDTLRCPIYFYNKQNYFSQIQQLLKDTQDNADSLDYSDSPVRQHLKNVYGCLSLSTLSAAAGAYVHLYTELLQANLLTTLGTFGLLFALISTPDNGKNQKLRLSYLLGFALLSGLGLGPLFQLIMTVNPSIIVTAFIGKL